MENIKQIRENVIKYIKKDDIDNLKNILHNNINDILYRRLLSFNTLSNLALCKTKNIIENTLNRAGVFFNTDIKDIEPFLKNNTNQKIVLFLYNSKWVENYYDNLYISAYGCSHISAFNNSNTYAHDMSVVKAFDNSSVFAFNHSFVEAYNTSKMHLSCYSTAVSNNKSIVNAQDFSCVNAFDNSHVNAKDFSIIRLFNKAKANKIDNNSIIVDLRNNIQLKNDKVYNAKDLQLQFEFYEEL